MTSLNLVNTASGNDLLSEGIMTENDQLLFLGSFDQLVHTVFVVCKTLDHIFYIPTKPR